MSYIGNQPITAAFITDSFSGTGSQVAFTLTVAPAGGASILVIVSGVVQDPSTYGVSGSTLTFSAAPPSGTGNISIRYLGVPAIGVVSTAYRTVTEFTATAGQTTFTPPSYTAGYINVYRNGVLLGSADYTATNGITVVLTTGATSGDLITTESFYVSSVLNAIPAVANAVTSSYLNTGAVTQTKIATGVAGTGPAFSAYQNSAQSGVAANTNTKILFDTEIFDTNSNFASSRFTPTVAGYYQLCGGVCIPNPSSSAYAQVMLFKNGALYQNGTASSGQNSVLYPMSTGSWLVYLNGSTDYAELYIYGGTGTYSLNPGASATYFAGTLTKAA